MENKKFNNKANAIRLEIGRTETEIAAWLYGKYMDKADEKGNVIVRAKHNDSPLCQVIIEDIDGSVCTLACRALCITPEHDMFYNCSSLDSVDKNYANYFDGTSNGYWAESCYETIDTLGTIMSLMSNIEKALSI